jgi:hypothetical protein
VFLVRHLLIVGKSVLAVKHHSRRLYHFDSSATSGFGRI